ncbi:MAG: hypothetical protein R3195_02000 [Gemmatimonadota bacterium]|nr:hypothetical protein [Gemmatimonadota bacterium]
MKKTYFTLTAAAVFLAAGCGGGGGTSGQVQNPEMTLAEAAENVLIVEIRNNLIPVTTVTAYVQQLGGRPRILGTVQANQTETYTVPGREVASGYTLIAEGEGREAIRSRRINEGAGYKTSWNLATNIITTERLDDH